MISGWLSERLEISLHAYQLACLTLIVKVYNLDSLFIFDFLGVAKKKTLTQKLNEFVFLTENTK